MAGARSRAAAAGGDGLLRKQMSASNISPYSQYYPEYQGLRPAEPRGIPMKILLDKEVSSEVHSKQPAPSLIAKLMGLETLPSSLGTGTRQGHSRSHSQTLPQDNFLFSEDLSRRRSTDDMPEIKDVYEVMEATDNVRTQNKLKSRNSGSKASNTLSSDMEFIRQKFTDAKRLSVDEAFHRSQEFNEALEALVANKDLLLEFLQEPSPFFAKNLDSRSSPVLSPRASRITILKPSRRVKAVDKEHVSAVGRNSASARYADSQNEAMLSYKKPTTDFSGGGFREDCALRDETSRSSDREDFLRSSPTRIVVLKPSLNKAHDMEGALPLDEEIFHFGCRRPMSPQGPKFQGEYTGDTMNYCSKVKASRDIARQVTAQMKRTVSRSNGQASPLEHDVDVWQARPLLHESKSKASRSSHLSSESYDDSNVDLGSSPAHSNLTSITREARKQLSERWKMANRTRDMAATAGGVNTLEDMFALSDREVLSVAVRSKVHHKASAEKYPADAVLGAQGWPLGISSSDGWKDSGVGGYTHSRSQQSPSSVRGSPKSSSRKRNGRFGELHMLRGVLEEGSNNCNDGHSVRKGRADNRRLKHHCHHYEVHLPCVNEEESLLCEREIHVNSEQLKNAISLQNNSEKFDDPALTNLSSEEPSFYFDGTPVLEQQEVMLRRETDLPLAAEDERCLVFDIDNPKKQNASLCTYQDVVPTNSIKPESSGFNDDEQPSPVSVLDPSSETEDSCTGCFDKISADLQGLRKQLRLLKMEAVGDDDEGSEIAFASDDESFGCSFGVSDAEDALRPFEDEEERDFCYIVDMINELRIDFASSDELLVACYSLDSPAITDIYELLEKKYEKLILWPRSERRLLFDLASRVLANIVSSTENHRSNGISKLYPLIWDRDTFVEELWQRLVCLRQELEFPQVTWEVDWAGSEDAVELFSTDMADAVSKSLIHELVTELLLHECR